ncbi:arsenate reductase (thioredoxin) [Aciduricibacillus chroicocephali]|uniref:Arsenate reductase n=1 Tax=Aciduricibacillus chroicocephali TaxID=3054939 RepID=A0ABY9KWW1_9BACI|nr:arsenate reductase (thioredoxin) [Bacillaceae bacterium 44XB]
MSKEIIYFLCTGNSCRSQIAEGFAKKYLGNEFDVFSAGIEAHGLNPKAVRAMLELNIDISGQVSETINPDILQRADWIITLCDDANERCPISPPSAKREHWGFEDPAKAKGTEEERWAVFQRVRDNIEARIKRFAEEAKMR